MKIVKLCLVPLLVILFMTNQVMAQSAYEEYRARVNKGTVGIVGGSVAGTYSRFTQDMSNLLDDIGNERIIAILGKGSVQNIYDLLFLKGVDMAIVQSDVLEAISKDPPIENIKSKIKYILKLYNEEVHMLVREDIVSIKQLTDTKISIGNKGSGTNMTARTVFDALDIPVEFINQDFNSGLDGLKRGEVTALVYVAGKPVSGFERIKKGQGLKLFPIEIDKRLSEAGYLGGTFTADDYPDLVDDFVDTIAVGAVLAVYDWQVGNSRYRKAKNMTVEILDSLQLLKEDRFHRKWEDVDPFASLDGWERFAPAEDWVNDNK